MHQPQPHIYLSIVKHQFCPSKSPSGPPLSRLPTEGHLGDFCRHWYCANCVLLMPHARLQPILDDLLDRWLGVAQVSALWFNVTSHKSPAVMLGLNGGNVCMVTVGPDVWIKWPWPRGSQQWAWSEGTRVYTVDTMKTLIERTRSLTWASTSVDPHRPLSC